MINIFKSKKSFLIFAIAWFTISGHTVFAWTESPSNPIYDPIVSAEKAYYPSVVKMSNTDYRMWYQTNSIPSNTTVGYATSPDGLSWTMVTNQVTGLLLNNAGHPLVKYIDSKFRIWYWNAATPYGNNAMHYAESVDGITWTGDTAITGNLTTTASGQWNSGIYGAVDVITNSNPTNTGTNPFDYKYAMYYDATSGGYEQIALGYSSDGIAWTLYGTGPVVAKGATGTWDSSYVAIGSTVIKGNFWTMWYSGGVSTSNDGIGCATSVDGLLWVKCPNNPIMSKTDGVAWRNNRTYTPKIIRDGSIYKMWFTGRDIATSNYAIGYATSAISPSADNLYIHEVSAGTIGLPAGITSLVFDENEVLNASASVSSASAGSIAIAGIPVLLSIFTSGDLSGVDLSTTKNIGGKLILVNKAVKMASGISGSPIRFVNPSVPSVTVSVPDATVALASSGWNGTVTTPKIGVTSGDTAPTGFSIGIAYDIGSATEVLLFDKPIQVTLSGLTGSIGYKSAGSTSWTRISSTCAGTYDAPTLSASLFPGECSITNGTDTKILTYHLTSFGTLVPADAPATLHVIKIVVNTSGGVSTPADFMIHVKNAGADVSGSPMSGTSTPGTSYSLSSGTYTISEDVNASYTQILGGDCDSSGNITLSAGANKTCTIINTNILISAPTSVAGGSSFALLPLVNITKIPSPMALPGGPGQVTFIYIVTNIGQTPMKGVWVKDDLCATVTYLFGDTNVDSSLDLNETWVYSCPKLVSKTELNTATVHGGSGGWDVYDVASATVVVGASITPPLIHVVTKPNLFVLPASGGIVTYTYTVTNTGTAPLGNVSVTDNKCTGLPGRVVGHPGDLNKNNLLEKDEIWTFTCQTNLTQTTTNIGTVTAEANGLIAVDLSPSTVVVGGIVPPTSLQGGATSDAGTLVATSTQSTNITAGMFPRALEFGMWGEDVVALQNILEQKGLLIVPNGVAKGFFGALTREAVAKYQKSVKLPSAGFFGPLTKNKLISESSK